MAREQLRFLVVMAHPHDFTHVAGTCGIHTGMGDDVTWVSMTSGRMTHNERLADELRKHPDEQDPAIVNQSAESYAAEKAAELKEVAALFGVTDVRVLPFTDKPFVVERQPDSIEAVREVVLEIRPHVVLTQSPFIDGRHAMASAANNDHTETGIAVMEGKLLAQLPRYGQRVPPYTVPATFFPGIYFPTEYWDFAVDVTEQIAARKKAEALYKSQGHDEEYAARRVEISVGSQGMRAGVPYAEGFVQESPQTVSHIELSEHTLRKGTQTRADTMRTIAGRK